MISNADYGIIAGEALNTLQWFFHLSLNYLVQYHNLSPRARKRDLPIIMIQNSTPRPEF
jgi:hypothetical protein